MSEVEELIQVLDETVPAPAPAPAPAKDVQRVVVIGGGGMNRAMGMALAARLIAHCGNRIEIVSTEDACLRTDSQSLLPTKDVCTAHLRGAQPGKGRKSRKNRENRWR